MACERALRMLGTRKMITALLTRMGCACATLRRDEQTPQDSDSGTNELLLADADDYSSSCQKNS